MDYLKLYKYFFSFLVVLFGITISCTPKEKDNHKECEPSNKNIIAMNDNTEPNIKKSEDDWKKELSPEQYYVLRESGTERPFTGKYNMHFEEGVYVCGGCGEELFESDSKFDGHCGWPSFDEELAGGKIIKKVDNSHGMKRVEVLCGNCGGHLGHLFDDGPTESGLRYCINSLSLNFKEK